MKLVVVDSFLVLCSWIWSMGLWIVSDLDHTVVSKHSTCKHPREVVGEAGSLQVTPRTEVIDSPGLKRGLTSICERLHIHGLQRLSSNRRLLPQDKILDVRTYGSLSEVVLLEFSAKQEFFMYRIVFLMMGIVLLSVAFRLSKSVAFYYSGAMSIGIIILVTLVRG